MAQDIYPAAGWITARLFIQLTYRLYSRPNAGPTIYPAAVWAAIGGT